MHLPYAVSSDHDNLSGLYSPVKRVVFKRAVQPERRALAFEFIERVRGRIVDQGRIVSCANPPDLWFALNIPPTTVEPGGDFSWEEMTKIFLFPEMESVSAPTIKEDIFWDQREAVSWDRSPPGSRRGPGKRYVPRFPG